MKKNILILFIFIFIYGCGCNKNISTPSTTGYYLSFNLNNTPVEFNEQTGNINDSAIAIYTNTTVNGSTIYSLAIMGISYSSGKVIQLAIAGQENITAKQYNVISATNLPMKGQTTLVSCAYGAKISTDTAFYINSDNTTGYVQITNFDLVNKIVEGTFALNSLTGYALPSSQLLNANFRNGKFKCRLKQ